MYMHMHMYVCVCVCDYCKWATRLCKLCDLTIKKIVILFIFTKLCKLRELAMKNSNPINFLPNYFMNHDLDYTYLISLFFDFWYIYYKPSWEITLIHSGSLEVQRLEAYSKYNHFHWKWIRIFLPSFRFYFAQNYQKDKYAIFDKYDYSTFLCSNYLYLYTYR